ncbi:MAG: hypothetical protein WBG86_17925 [Polyangiales bacterium]
MGRLIEQLREVRERLHRLDEPGSIVHADALALAAIVASVAEELEVSTNTVMAESATRDATSGADEAPRASVATPQADADSGDSTAPDGRWFPRPWGVAGRDERDDDAPAFGLAGAMA